MFSHNFYENVWVFVRVFNRVINFNYMNVVRLNEFSGRNITRRIIKLIEVKRFWEGFSSY